MSDGGKVIDLASIRTRRGADPGQVPCANCGEAIAPLSERCIHCGISFQGFAEDFAPDPDPGRAARARRRRAIIAAAAVIAMILATTGWLWR